MKKVTIAVLAAVALVAGGTVNAAAKKPAHAGGKKAAKSKRCAKSQKVGFVVKGAFASSDGVSITLTNPHGNKHARGWLAQNGPSFDLGSVAVSFEGVTDADGDGDVDLDDVQTTDEVRVIGKLTQPKKRCAGESSLTVRKIKVVRELADVPADGGTEQPPTGGDPVQPPVI